MGINPNLPKETRFFLLMLQKERPFDKEKGSTILRMFKNDRSLQQQGRSPLKLQRNHKEQWIVFHKNSL